MSLTEDVIFSDPVLQRVFFDPRRLAPMFGRDAIVNIALHKISLLEVEFLKAKTADLAEQLAWRIRRYYFLARRHCDGRHLGYLERLVADGCQHVELFAHNEREPVFNIDYRARAAYRHRYTYRPPTPSRHRSRRTRSV